MAYLPKSKYQILYTNGGEFLLSSTRQEYVGKYLKLDNGKNFAGEDINNIKGEIIPLNIIPNNSNFNSKPLNNRIYFNLNKDLVTRQSNYLPILSYTPLPTPLDYNGGKFQRYLVLKVNTKEFTEISKNTYDNFNKGKYDNITYNRFSIEWSLKENNSEINDNLLRFYEPQLPGIYNFFPDKGQFGFIRGVVNIKNETGTRLYPDGNYIDNNLPRVYQIGNNKINTNTNPNVPTGQYCGNCAFYKKEFCSQWKATVRKNYWCSLYKESGSPT